MAFDFDTFLAEEGDATTPQNGGFDFDKFISEETGKIPFGTLAQRTVADATKAVATTLNPAGAISSAVNTAADPAVQAKVAPWLPTVGGVLGLGFGPLGAAAGTGAGAIVENALKVTQNDPNAPRTPLDAAKYAMGQTALAGAGEANAVLKAAPNALSYGSRATGFVADKLGNAAVGAGRRALGFSKRFLGKPGQLEKANEVAGTMLNEGVIRPFSGAGAMMERAEDLAETSGASIGKTLSGLHEAGARSLDTSAVVQDIYSQLSPKYEGGAYDAQKRIVEEIAETIRAHGEGPLTFESAQQLKNTLQDLGKFQAGGDNVRQDLYRRASGIIRNALDESVAAASTETPGLAAKYAADKKRFGHSQEAIRALTNRTSSEQGNRLISGTDFVAGAGAASTGQIPLADLPGKLGLALAAKRGIERYGHSTAAVTYKKAADLIKNNAFGINTTRRALISRLITREGDDNSSR